MLDILIIISILFGVVALFQFFIAVPAAFFVTVAVLFTIWAINKFERRRKEQRS